MDNATKILSFLYLEDENLLIEEDIVISEDAYILFAKIKKPKQTICPRCGSIKCRSKGVVHQTINNTFKKYQGKEIILVLAKHKYHCLDCDNYFRDEIKLVEKSNRISNGVKEEIIEDLKTVRSFKSIADQHSISVTEVIRTFDNLPATSAAALRIAICIDEFNFKVTPNNKYPVVISDAKSGFILDIVASRKYEFLKDYLRKKNSIELSTVKFVCTDMHETFRRITKEYFKNAILIVDFFHVARQFTTIVNEKRKEAMNCFDRKSATYNFLKTQWHAFLVNPNELDSKYDKGIKWNKSVYQASELVLKFAKLSQPLFDIYKLYKDFCTYMSENKFGEIKEIETSLSFIIHKASQSTDKDVNKLGLTLLNWSEEIINAYSFRNELKLSNAIAEGNNNRIRKVINVSYGYLSFFRMRKRVLYIQHFNRKKRGT